MYRIKRPRVTTMKHYYAMFSDTGNFASKWHKNAKKIQIEKAKKIKTDDFTYE